MKRYFAAGMPLRLLMILLGPLYVAGSFAQEISDTIRKPDQSVIDSLEIRQQFVKDSLLAREIFVRDSVQRRLHILDSLTFLQKELPGLLEAYHRVYKEDIFLHGYDIKIIGDSVLGDYSYLILPFSLTQPYTPWKGRVSLSGDPVKINVDKQTQRITTIQAPLMKCSFAWGSSNSVLVLNERSTIQKNGWGQFYTTPIDSVFYDRNKRIVKIKKYIQVYSLVNGNQRGVPLFLQLTHVKQYEYGPDHRVTRYQIVKFCDRWKAYEKSKVCSIITYSFSEQNNTIVLTRRNDPSNNYSDGSYTYVFDEDDHPKSISFQNISNTENWQRTIELNKEGNVHCYFDKVNGVLKQSLCMIYHTDDPNAKYPVENITTVFEDDGVSYYQKNNTTGQIRTRDRMTLEWSSWK